MKFEKWLEETTVAGDIAQPLARGKVDVVGAGCPEGMVKDKKGNCVPKGEKISEAKDLREYQELYRTDRYDLIAKKLMKQAKGKKITFRDIEQAIIDEFAPQPFDRYDHQEVVDRLKEKRFKVESISKFKEGMVFEAGPRWKYQDSRGVWQTGEFLKFSDRGGTDVTYFFKRDKTGETDVVSGSRLKKAKRIWGKKNEAVVLTDPESLTAQWKKKAKENPDVAHWMQIAKIYKGSAKRCHDAYRAHLKKMNMTPAEINKEIGKIGEGK